MVDYNKEKHKYCIIVGRKMRPRRSAPPTVFDSYEDAEDFGIKSYGLKFFNIKGGWRVIKTKNKVIYPLTIGDIIKKIK